MIRYVKQPDLTGCGPIAILNALKWAQVKISLKDYQRLRTLCNTSNKGTKRAGIDSALKSQRYIRHKYIENSRVEDIDRALQSGKAVILGYSKLPGDGTGRDAHYVFISGKTGINYELINHVSDKDFDLVSSKNRSKLIKTKENIPLKELKRIISSHYIYKKQGLLELWVIEKV